MKKYNFALLLKKLNKEFIKNLKTALGMFKIILK